MAKLIISSDLAVGQSLSKAYVDAGFKDCSQHLHNNIFIAAHKKKRKPLENMWVAANGDYIAVIGTAIYCGRKKDSALEYVYNEFDEGNIEGLRSKLFGNYIIAINKNNVTYVFSDRYHVIPAYYFVDNERFVITNSLWHLANVIEDRGINNTYLLEETFLVAPVGRNTPFPKIKKLFGDNYLRIQDGILLVKDFVINDNYLYVKNLSFEAILDEYAKLVNTEFKKVADAYGGLDFGIQQTGGLDNRTIFAGFMCQGIKPKTYYGVGNTSLTNTKVADLEIVKKYQNKFGLSTHIMNWSHNWITDINLWNQQVLKYGFHQSLYGGCQNFFNEYENLIKPMPDFMECGYYGEVLRQREWAYQRKDSKQVYTLAEFLDGYLLDVGYGGFFRESFCADFKAARQHIRESYVNEIEKLNLELGENEEFNLDLWNKIEWIQMRNCNSTSCQFLNDYTSSIAFFSTNNLHDFALNIPGNMLQNARFQLALIEKLFSLALEIPILSHGQPYHYNFSAKTITPINNNGAVARVKSFVKKIPVVGEISRRIYMAINKHLIGGVESNIRSDLDAILLRNKDIIKTNPKKYKDGLVYYVVLASYVNAISIIQDKRRKAEKD